MMRNLSGAHDDGWLRPSARADFAGAGDVTFEVYLPELPRGRPKRVAVLVGTDFHQIEVPRGKVSQLGPFSLPEGGGRVAIDCAETEPPTEGDARDLGVRLVRVLADGEDVALPLPGGAGTAAAGPQEAT